MIDSITISQQYINEILSIVGYPIITITDLELTEDQLKSLVIIPSVREYYRWFPIETKTEYSISGSFEIDFPNDTTYSIVEARLNTVGDIPATPAQGNAYVNSRYWRREGGYGAGYGTGNDYGMRNSYVLQQALAQSYVDKYKAFKVNTDEQNKKIFGYSNATGKLNVIWADYSEDFADIVYNRLTEVIKLCQSKLLEVLLMLRGQSNAEIPQDFNLSLFEDKYEELRTEVLNKWQKISKICIIKG